MRLGYCSHGLLAAYTSNTPACEFRVCVAITLYHNCGVLAVLQYLCIKPSDLVESVFQHVMWRQFIKHLTTCRHIVTVQCESWYKERHSYFS